MDQALYRFHYFFILSYTLFNWFLMVEAILFMFDNLIVRLNFLCAFAVLFVHGAKSV